MQPGSVVADRFEVERLAGSGGMGDVYQARDRLTGEHVALKVLLQLAGGDRFQREAALLAELRHPAIVRYVAHGVTPAGGRYLAMEWLEGKDLSDLLRERQRLSIDECLVIARRVAEALAVAHARQIVHRDIKPSNLFLAGGRVDGIRLLDFGVARAASGIRVATKTGQLLGTPGYMAPEQARGEPTVDARADVFSLGCVLFECLTGRPAFVGEHVMALLAKILLEDVPHARSVRADVPAALDRLVAAMVAKEASGRLVDGAAVLAELDRIEGASRAEASSTSLSVVPKSAITTGEQRLLCVITAGVPEMSTVLDEVTAPTIAEGAPTASPALRDLVERHGGRFEQLHDGSIVVTLTGQGSAIDQASQAARCALALRAELPSAGISLATGRGVMGERWPVGPVIERAVKLLRLAERRATTELSVRIDDVTAGLLGHRFEMGGDADGLALVAEREVEEGARTLLGFPTPCVGRDVDLRTLEAVFGEVASESMARAALVTAPTGVGKSRLRYELVHRLKSADDPVEVWLGRGDPLTAGAPFAILARALRQAAGIQGGEALGVRQKKLAARVARHVGASDARRVTEFLGELVGAPFAADTSVELRAARADPMLMGDQMRRAFEDLLAAECAAQPVVLVLEDLHWGDLPTVKFIDSALRSLAELPLFVLGLARPEVRDAFPKLWSDRGLVRVELAELSRKASEKLVRHVLGKDAPAATVARIVERGAGNAFYIEELVRAVAAGSGDTLPETVVAMVEKRLEELEPEARRVLRAASVFGEVFWRGGVESLLGAAEGAGEARAWIEVLGERELVTRRGASRLAGQEEHQFRSALVREAAYAMLTDDDRVTGHGLAAAWLERSGEEDGLVIAEHFERGGAPRRAVVGLRRAAEQALEGNDFAAAVARADRGVANGADAEDLAALHAIAAKAHGWRGDLAEAEARGVLAMQAAGEGTPLYWDALEQVAVAAGKLGHEDRVRGLARTVAARLDAGPLAGPPCAAAALVAQRLLLAGDYELAGILLDRVEAAGQELASEPATYARLCQARAMRASFAGDAAGYLRLTEEAATALERIGNLRSTCSSRANLGHAYMEIGQYAQAESTLREAEAAALRMGLPNIAATAAHNLGLVLALLGRLDEAREVEAAAIDTFVAHANRRMEAGARVYLARIALLAGDFDAAEREVRRALDLEAGQPLRCFALAVLAAVLLAKGAPVLAIAQARDAMALLDELGTIDEAEPLVRLVHAEALHAVGLRDEAKLEIDAARDHLVERADKIKDEPWRRSFLEAVPEHARTMELASSIS